MADNWEERIYRDFVKGTGDPANFSLYLIQPDEYPVASQIVTHLRFLATNREPLTRETKKLLVKTDQGTWPEDTRPISPSHTVQWLAIEHHGAYWEVSYGSREFSSSFSEAARGRTLAEALTAVMEEG